MDGIGAQDTGGRAGLVMVNQHVGAELGFALLVGAAGYRFELGAASLLVAALIGGLTVRARPTERGLAADNGLLLVEDGRVTRVPAELRGLELLQEISRLLRSENVTMTKLGTDLTLWHVEGAGTPNPVASRLMAGYGFEPVTGAAVVAGPLIGHMPFPLGSDAAEGLALRLDQ